MYKNLLKLLFSVNVFCAFVVHAELESVNNAIVELRSDNWCPHACSKNNKHQGYMVDIARFSFERAGIKVNYENVSWARALAEAKAGKNIGLVGAAHDGAPSPYLFPEEEQGHSLNCFYTLINDAWQYTGVPSLTNRRLGSAEGYEYNYTLDNYIARHKNTDRVQTISDQDPVIKNLRKLQLGRIDVVLGDNLVIEYEANELQPPLLLNKSGCIGLEGKNYVVFLQSNPRAAFYTKLLTDGVNELRRSGQLKQIMANYHLNDWR